MAGPFCAESPVLRSAPRHRCWLLLLSCLLALPLQAAPLLRFAVDNSLAPPMASLAGGRMQLQGGIVFDFGRALAAELGRQASFQPVPTRRTPLLLEAGAADLLCFYSPVWLGEAAPAGARRFGWTRSFVEDKDVLLQPVAAKPARRIDDLRGMRVGAILGYVYPDFQRLVDAGLAQRDDTHAIEANLAKLRAGRLQGAIVNEVNFHYLLRQQPALGRDLQQTLTVSEFALACAVSRRSAVPLARIDAAIGALQRRGAIAAIYAAYQ